MNDHYLQSKKKKKKTVHEETFEVVHKKMGSEISENSNIAQKIHLNNQWSSPPKISLDSQIKQYNIIKQSMVIFFNLTVEQYIKNQFFSKHFLGAMFFILPVLNILITITSD